MISAAWFTEPGTVLDWGRAVAALICAVAGGMAAEVIVAYRRSGKPVAGHVRTISASYLLFAVLLVYAHLVQIGRPSSVGPVTVPLSIVAGIFGIVGLFRILRLASGKTTQTEKGLTDD